MPCGNRTRLARLEAWHLCRSAKGTSAAAAGLEPASGRLTAAYPYQHGSHRKISRRGWSRTSIFVLPKHADFPSLPHAE